MYACMYGRMSVCMYACMYVCMYVSVYVMYVRPYLLGVTVSAFINTLVRPDLPFSPGWNA